MKKKNTPLVILIAVLCVLLVSAAGMLLMNFVWLRQENRQMDEQFIRELEESQKTIDKLKEQEAELDSEITKAKMTSTPLPDPATETEEFLISIQDCQPGETLDANALYMDNPGIYFTAQEIQEGDEVYQRISGILSTGNRKTTLNELRYLRMPYYNQDGGIQVGEMVVQKAIAQDVLGGCQKLFQKQYQISGMNLEDNCWLGVNDWEKLKEKLNFSKEDEISDKASYITTE